MASQEAASQRFNIHGYNVAKGLLQKHFGNKYKIALSWPTIKSEDVKALPTNMRLMVSKLPHKLIEEWQAKAQEIIARSNGKALFIDVAFLEKHVSILSNLIFGKIADASQNTLGLRPSTKLHLQEKTIAKGNSFATTVTSDNSEEEKTMTNHSRIQEGLQCHCCSHAHFLDKCQQFKGKKHRDKIFFLKRKESVLDAFLLDMKAMIVISA